MKKIIVVLCCFLLWSCSPFSNDFEDKGVQSTIDDVLKQKSLSKNEYDQIKHLDLSYRNVNSLEGLEKLKGLESLTLSNNSIKDLNPLKNLKELKILDIQNNLVEDLSPLSQLKNLEVLLIRNNPVESIETIEILFSNLETTDFLVKVNFNDLNFETYIREQLKIPEAAITFYDLEKIRSIDIKDQNIRDITGIAYMGQLEKIVITNEVSGLEGLSNLENLKHVVLTNNKLKEISLLNKSEYIEYLDVSYNEINTLEGIDVFQNLSFLNVSYNTLNQLEQLNKSYKLKILYAKGNPILTYENSQELLNQLEETDIFIVYFNDSQLDLAIKTQLNKVNGVLTLDNFKKITSLEAKGYGISSLEGIELLENLVSLNISDNSISSLEPLTGLESLSILKASNNSIEELSPFVYLKSLEILELKDNLITDLGPLIYLNNLKYLYLEGNPIIENSLNETLRNQIPYTDDW